jgi:hypothetical protein
MFYTKRRSILTLNQDTFSFLGPIWLIEAGRTTAIQIGRQYMLRITARVKEICMMNTMQTVQSCGLRRTRDKRGRSMTRGP